MRWKQIGIRSSTNSKCWTSKQSCEESAHDQARVCFREAGAESKQHEYGEEHQVDSFSAFPFAEWCSDDWTEREAERVKRYSDERSRARYVEVTHDVCERGCIH